MIPQLVVLCRRYRIEYAKTLRKLLRAEAAPLVAVALLLTSVVPGQAALQQNPQCDALETAFPHADTSSAAGNAFRPLPAVHPAATGPGAHTLAIDLLLQRPTGVAGQIRIGNYWVQDVPMFLLP
ncbi:MAG: hypothetical protein INR62_10490, partial [Rhodospirillales bacterium]|nr:hypothetical protein [Acetobacter sp.]